MQEHVGAHIYNSQHPLQMQTESYRTIKLLFKPSTDNNGFLNLVQWPGKVVQ
jgi:hypothetical protein